MLIPGLIVNYADSSLQFFTADGTFYTSRQFGGPTGTIASRFWLPFERPSDTAAAGKASPQLINLINALANADYLEAVWEIVQAAIPSMPFPPSDYAPYANAIIGKPLALVNVGFSLELSQPPLWRQHTLPMPDPVDAQGDPERRKAKEKMDQYKFKIKIGDVGALPNPRPRQSRGLPDKLTAVSAERTTIRWGGRLLEEFRHRHFHRHQFRPDVQLQRTPEGQGLLYFHRAREFPDGDTILPRADRCSTYVDIGAWICIALRTASYGQNAGRDDVD